MSSASCTGDRGRLKEILKEEKFDIIFLNETDTKNVQCKKDYEIDGYETILPKIPTLNPLVRILCLVKKEIANEITCREDLMTADFPSIWLETKNITGKNTLIAGFYREWSQNGNDSEDQQVKRMETFTQQISKASDFAKRIIILGDANLCTAKWNLDKFKHKKEK